MSDRALLKANAMAVADAIPLLFGDRVEVVLHDLDTETVAHITNPFSHREVGDPSNMQEIDFRGSGFVIGPYEKVHWDGRVIRSISIAFRDPQGHAQYMLCINHDQADLQQLHRLVDALVPNRPNEDRPDALFRNDWHEKLNVFVSDWCGAEGARADALSRDQRRALLAALDGSGAMNEKHAASYVARLLGVSRATIYNDLKKDSSHVQ